MPPVTRSNNERVVVISDDDEDGLDEHHVRRARTRPSIGSPKSLRRVGKRQRTDPGPATGPSGQTRVDAFPRLQLNFDADNNGFAQAFPSFTNYSPAEEPPSIAQSSAAGAPECPKPSEVHQKQQQCPYAWDPKFTLRMFCGPGYEAFPVPVDLDPGFQEICNKYDESSRRQHRRGGNLNQQGGVESYVEFPESFDEDNIESLLQADQQRPMTPAEETCFTQILDILPDIDTNFLASTIKSQCESYTFGRETVDVIPETSTILTSILEADYPRAEKQISREPDPFESETGRTIKLLKGHRENPDYSKDALILLAGQFNHTPSCFIHRLLTKERKCLWDAYIYLEDADSNYFQRTQKPYRRLKQPRTQVERKYQRNSPYRDPQYYVQLVTEFQAVRQHVARDVLQAMSDRAKADFEESNKERHKADGMILECQVCFEDEVPTNRAVTCLAEPVGHAFCYSCIESLADSQVGLMKHEMICMDGSGCREKLDPDGVARAVPIKTFDRLQLNEQQAELTAAFPEGLEQCPFCDFKALCGSIEEEPVFSCQHPDCFRVTCRKCQETSHHGKTCEEVKKDRGLDARHKIEEARSEAMMRPCPQCKKKIVKEDGCNKMRCPCGAILCYVCKTDLSKLRDGYHHFEGRGSGKCPLYDVDGIQQHDIDANEAEKEAIKAAKAKDENVNEKDLQIETGTKDPPAYGSTIDDWQAGVVAAMAADAPRYLEPDYDANDFDLAMGHRIHNFHNEVHRRREARRERARAPYRPDHVAVPQVQVPNPNFLNVRQPQGLEAIPSQGGAANQVNNNATAAIANTVQAHPNFLGHGRPDNQNQDQDLQLNDFALQANFEFGFEPGQQNWRDQFRPPTPVPGANRIPRMFAHNRANTFPAPAYGALNNGGGVNYGANLGNGPYNQAAAAAEAAWAQPMLNRERYAQNQPPARPYPPQQYHAQYAWQGQRY